MQAVQLLAVVLKVLNIATRALTHQRTEGIVVADLFHRTAGIHHHAVVAKVVLHVEVVLRCRSAERYIAAINQQLLHPVTIDVVADIELRLIALSRGIARYHLLHPRCTILIVNIPSVSESGSRGQI